MNRTSILLIFTTLVLVGFSIIGIPFESNNVLIDSTVRIFSFALIYFVLFILFRQVKKIQSKTARILGYSSIGLLSLLFIIGAFWNNIIRFNNEFDWRTYQICENQNGTKIARQIRTISGSIDDFRDRLIIFEFNDQNRISININVKNFDGPWNIYDLEHPRMFVVNELE